MENRVEQRAHLLHFSINLLKPPQETHIKWGCTRPYILGQREYNLSPNSS
jgi:hypothetical protein